MKFATQRLAKISAQFEKLIKQGEEEFAVMIMDYPYEISVPLTVNKDERDLTFIYEIEVIEIWLCEHITNEYIAFPNSAMGKYKAMWKYCYFKDKDDATRFKLVWG